MNARDVIEQASGILNDPEHDRWGLSQLVGFYNDARRAVVLVRPDANAVTKPVELKKGTLQTIPRGGLQLIDVVRNLPGGEPVTQIDRETLDASIEGWHSESPDDDEPIDHYTWDERRPREFYVTPPAAEGQKVELVYAQTPDPIKPPEGSGSWPEFDLDPIYIGPVRDWMLYLAHSLNTSEAAPSRMGHYYEAFYHALGKTRVRAEALVGPRPYRQYRRESEDD